MLMANVYHELITLSNFDSLQTAAPVLMWAELFATARTLADTDVLNLTPRLEAA